MGFLRNLFSSDSNDIEEENKQLRKKRKHTQEELDETKEKLEDIKEFQKKLEENKDKDIELLKDKDLMNKLSEVVELTSNLDFSSTYEKYCFKMLNEKYNITQEEFEEILEGFGNEYGIEYVDIMLQKVCEKVFTRMGEKKQPSKKPLPKFMIN